jgi:hypothetical protein
MADRYLKAVQRPNLIAPERFAEALETADARAGLRSFQEGCDRGFMEIVFQFRMSNLVVPTSAAQNGRKVRASRKHCADLPQIE